MSQATITTSIPISFNTLYTINLRRQKFSCLHIRENIFALRDQENGNKDRRIHIVSINTTDKPTSRRPMPPQAAAAFKRFQDFK